MSGEPDIIYQTQTTNRGKVAMAWRLDPDSYGVDALLSLGELHDDEDIFGAGDVDEDGVDEIVSQRGDRLFYRKLSGGELMGAIEIYSPPLLGTVRAVGMGDIDGHFAEDIILVRDGQASYWSLRNGQRTFIGGPIGHQLPPEWTLLGVGNIQ